MPRRNKRKDFSIGKEAVFFESNHRNSKPKPECRGCAFTGHGGVCTVSDGKCLIGPADSEKNLNKENIHHNRQQAAILI